MPIKPRSQHKKKSVYNALRIKIYLLELRVACWQATFLKYQSWKANGVRGRVIDSVVKDYERLSKL